MRADCVKRRYAVHSQSGIGIRQRQYVVDKPGAATTCGDSPLTQTHLPRQTDRQLWNHTGHPRALFKAPFDRFQKLC